jgi:hypothetical protein
MRGDRLKAASEGPRARGWDGAAPRKPGGGYLAQKGDWVDCESCSRYSTNGISMAIAFAHNDAAGGCYPNFPEVITPAENHDWGQRRYRTVT